MSRRRASVAISIVALALSAVLVYSLVQIFSYQQETRAVDQLTAELSADPGLSALRARNPDTVAWLTVGGTRIDYPVVQAADNDFYLSHDFDRRSTPAGWIFADFRSEFDPLLANTIIYGHGRQDGTMFGTLSEVQRADWAESGHELRLETDAGVTSWRVFSAYTIPVTDDYLAVTFNTAAERQAYVARVTARSVGDFGTLVPEGAPILTLSTCGPGDTTRVVVHAVQLAQ